MTTNEYPAPFLVPDDDQGDGELTNALRALYAAPDAAGYWSALEQRIMDRIAGGETLDAWWSVPAQWARIGLIAAGFALIVSASIFLRSRAEQHQMAYDSVLGPVAGPTLAIRDDQSTISYINGR